MSDGGFDFGFGDGGGKGADFGNLFGGDDKGGGEGAGAGGGAGEGVGGGGSAGWEGGAMAGLTQPETSDFNATTSGFNAETSGFNPEFPTLTPGDPATSFPDSAAPDYFEPQTPLLTPDYPGPGGPGWDVAEAGVASGASGMEPLGGGGDPAIGFDGSSGKVPDGGWPGSIYGDTELPGGATPTAGTQPDWSAIGPLAQPVAPTYNYGDYAAQPAGTGAAPDIAAINAINGGGGAGAGGGFGGGAALNDPGMATVPDPGMATVNPGGIGAGGALTGGAGGGGFGDLTATPYGTNPQTPYGTPNPLYDVPAATTAATPAGTGAAAATPKEKGWLDYLGTNPAATALAAGGLGYNIFKGNETAAALKAAMGGKAPDAALAAVATNAANAGATRVAEGAEMVGAGNKALTKAAESNQATGSALIDRGNANVQAAVGDLRETATPLARAGDALLTQGPQNVAGEAAKGLQALAVTPTATAATLQNQGTGLTGYVGSGTLPPALQSQLDTEFNDQKTAIISQHAKRGLPTNPARNSGLRSELANLENRKVIAGNEMAAKLATTGNTLAGTGLNASQVAGGLQTNVGQLGTSATGQGVQAAQVAGGLQGTAGQLGTGQTNAGVNSNQLAGTNLAQATGAGNTLAGTGAMLQGTAATGYNNLMTAEQAQQAQLQKAIAQMAAALNGQQVAVPKTV